MHPPKVANQDFHDMRMNGAIRIRNDQFWSAHLTSFDTTSLVAADYIGIYRRLLRGMTISIGGVHRGGTSKSAFVYWVELYVLSEVVGFCFVSIQECFMVSSYP